MQNMLENQPYPVETTFFKTRYFPRLTFRHGQTKLFGNGKLQINGIPQRNASG